MTDFYDGDPALCLDENGSRLVFTGGQPAMDPGLVNMVLISLFTAPGWAGNDLFDDPEKKIGSDFLSAAQQPITLTALNDIRDAAQKALESDILGKVTITVTNPNGFRIDVLIKIEPPGADTGVLIISKNGLNWQAQARSEYEQICP